MYSYVTLQQFVGIRDKYLTSAVRSFRSVLIFQHGVAFDEIEPHNRGAKPSLISYIRSCKPNNRRAVSAKLKAVAARTSLMIKRFAVEPRSKLTLKLSVQWAATMSPDFQDSDRRQRPVSARYLRLPYDR